MKKILGKIKDSWRDNRVLFVLMTILIICLIVILFMVGDYFLGSTKDKYGDRLDGINKVKITDKQIENYGKKIREDEKIKNCCIHKRGKHGSINIEFDGATLDDAKAKTAATVELFEEKYLKYYDINYTIKQKKTDSGEAFVKQAAHNANGTGLVWTNTSQSAN